VLLHCRHGEGVGAMCPVRVRGTGEAASTELACGGQMRELRGGGGEEGELRHKVIDRSKNGSQWHMEEGEKKIFFRAVAYGSC
jgi:hypothetical protein